MKIPVGYPFDSPFGYIKSDYQYNYRHNAHILGGGSICLDMLQNMKGHFSNKENTGWSSSYTLKTLILQLRIFLQYPDT